MRSLLGLLLLVTASHAETVALAGLKQPVEVLRDRWGVPHIYARDASDLFFAQGYMAARDRLFQLDLWRRINTGRLAEVLGPGALERDRIARLMLYRGDWNREWTSYAPDARAIIESFVAGVNAYIGSLQGRRPIEFQKAGYDPGPWSPKDCVARIAGLGVTSNLAAEIRAALAVQRHGLAHVQEHFFSNPATKLEIPSGLNPSDISKTVLDLYTAATGPVRFGSAQESNNWVAGGGLTASGKPLLANDPHRPVGLPSLRKIAHLSAPGWDVIGAGEPALPGVAIGHNGQIAWGITTIPTDQQDLYVETLNPANSGEYQYRGTWRKFEIARERIAVKGESAPRTVELRYSVHGPVFHLDADRRRAYALRWVGAEPGTAGYLASLAVGRATNWREFQAAAARWRGPGHNIVYADRAGNIGWQATGLIPVRRGWNGLLPVPGAGGKYEWDGFVTFERMPRLFNPPRRFIATANQNNMPAGFPHGVSYRFTPPFRYDRIVEMLTSGAKFGVSDFERMQQDATSLAARRFQAILRKWRPGNAREAGVRDRLLAWNGHLGTASWEAAVYAAWIKAITSRLVPADLEEISGLTVVLDRLDASPHGADLSAALHDALSDLRQRLGAEESGWRWGRLHTIAFRHPLGVAEWAHGPVERPGDGFTVNATGGGNYRQASGASYRHVIDLADWDRSTATNTPGESGDPQSPHFSDLVKPWAAGEYHPLPFTRKAVEAATRERIRLTPAP